MESWCCARAWCRRLDVKHITGGYISILTHRLWGNIKKIHYTLVHFTIPLRELSSSGSTPHKYGDHYIRPLEVKW